MGFLSGDYQKEFSQLKWEVYDKQIRAKFLAKIGINPDQPIDEETE